MAKIVTCRHCQQLKPKSTQAGNICSDCYKIYCDNYRAKNRERLLEKQKAYRDEQKSKDPAFLEVQRVRGRKYFADLRHAAIMAYGGYICACCGESEPRFLTLDHIFNDGAAHRRTLKGRGAVIYKWLRDHNYPAGFQILCMNCNHGKAMNKGICPHKTAQSNRVNSGKLQTGQS